METPKYLPTDMGFGSIWYILSIEHYSAYSILQYTTTLMNLVGVIVREDSLCTGASAAQSHFHEVSKSRVHRLKGKTDG